MSIEREQNHQLAEKIAALFVPPEKVLENVMDIVELMDASSTGGDALRERIEKMPTYPYDTWEGKVLVSRSDVLALLAPPLIKQEAEPALHEEMAEWKRMFSIASRACGNWREWPDHPTTNAPQFDHPDWLCALRAIHERDELKAIKQEAETPLRKQIEQKLNNLPFDPKSASKQEVVAPVGERVTGWMKDCDFDEGVMNAKYQRPLVFAKKEDLLKANPDMQDPECNVYAMRVYISDADAEDETVASSVPGPSEGLAPEILGYLAEFKTGEKKSKTHAFCYDYNSAAEYIAENNRARRIFEPKVIALVAAQSAAGTKPDPSLPLPEDDEGVRR